MQRWHAERNLMTRRWRQELAKHGDNHPHSEGYPHMALAPPSLAPAVECHCSQGIGSMRWRKPLDCGRARCGICHFGRNYIRPARANKRREAIRFDLEAELQ
jgi:hypothetical protein